MEETRRASTFTIAIIGVMTAVTCIIAPFSIAIPISPVPVSFTNLSIFISVFVLGWKKGTVSYLIYLLLGMSGLPVFSGFTSGPAKLMGPTGGYLIGFIFTSVICGWFIENFSGKKYMYVLGMVLGMAVAYGFGTIWLAYSTGRTFIEAFAGAVLPFLSGDGVKIAAAVAIGPILQTQLKRAGVLAVNE